MSPDHRFDSLPNRNLKERIDGAEFLLQNLFLPTSYSNEVQMLFTCVAPTAVEDFLYYETLCNNTVLHIEADFPGLPEVPGDLSPESQRILSWLKQNKEKGLYPDPYVILLVLYFLHEMHNKKLDRCLASLYNLKDPDHFLARCLVAASETQNQTSYQSMATAYSLLFPELGANRDVIRSSIQNSLFPIVKHSSFTYVLEDDPDSLFGRETLDSHVEGPVIADFKIRVQHFLDDKFDGKTKGFAYPDYVLYLLKKERNGIDDFDGSLKAFWKETVGTSRAQTIINLRPSDIDLARFCLSLGMDQRVYQRLQKLRDSYPPFVEAEKNAAKKKGMGVLTKKKSRMLGVFLSQASARLLEARTLCQGDTRRIPRQMLVNASIQLLSEDVSGLVKVTEEELRSFMLREDVIQTLMARQNSRKENS